MYSTYWLRRYVLTTIFFHITYLLINETAIYVKSFIFLFIA